MKRMIYEGEEIPKGYGVAYRHWLYNKLVCYPIPLNIIIALARKIWIWCMWKHGLYNKLVCYPIPLNIIIALARKIWIWCMWKHGLHRNDYDQYLWIRTQVAEVYCEITGGTLSYPDYHAKTVLGYFEQYNLSKAITQEDVKMFINNCETLKELQDELRSYFEIE